jgi:hypothetical protein
VLVSAPGDDVPFFDDEFLAELQGLSSGPAAPLAPLADDLHARLAGILQRDGRALDEEEFAALPPEAALERTDALLEACRQGGRRGALDAAENFVVFFQALLPTLQGDAARAIQRIFFHLIPVLLQIAWHGFGDRELDAQEGRRALKGLESILTEIAGVRLRPSESDLVLRSIDQIARLLGSGEYAMAEEMATSHLLAVIRKNKVARALYRIMEVEARVQVYLKEKLGHTTPQIRIPEDFGPLADYGPLQVLREDGPEGPRAYLQLQIPDLPRLRDVLVTLMRDDGLIGYELRLDALGSVPLEMGSGTWRIGLTYQPEE